MSYLVNYYVEVEDHTDHIRLESVMRNSRYAFIEASRYDPICSSPNPARSLEEAEERMKTLPTESDSI